MTNIEPIVFIDTETLSFNGPIWEIAWITVDFNGAPLWMGEQSILVQHEFDQHEYDQMPESFRRDYQDRYDPHQAVDPESVVETLRTALKRAAHLDNRPVPAGSNPGYDVQRIEALAAGLGLEPLPWHYCPENIPTLARGWLAGKGIRPAPPWKSDFISRICGIDPQAYQRHTAMGDCQWSYELWKAVSGL